MKPNMKHMQLLIWLTQLGLSTALPLAGFILLAVWLHRSLHWGAWVVVAGVIFGIVSAVDGLRASLKSMERLTKDTKKEPPIGFNNHD